MTLSATITAMATRAMQDGITRQDAEVEPGNRLHQWVQGHVRYRPEQEWFILFTLACEIGRQTGNFAPRNRV